MKIRMITRHEPDFPEALIEHVSDCRNIYVSGNTEILKMKSIAIVGSRNCTSYGIAVARGLAKSAAEHGVAVISGLARGIDSAAHRSALEAGGKTVGVLGTGIDVFYPAENPQFIITVLAEDSNRTGESAAPVFASLCDRIYRMGYLEEP